ncbi:hypothetical protein EYC84_003241 [Monilinia fructicola]|uniref:Uncharacterized protein n=1 Tax=Monilinia fructicola TaxID=38448 RepID=A0A5M9JY47_MONFR|nr:hypothetical protein EYC84_003241 [Monilinia fructicola]
MWNPDALQRTTEGLIAVLLSLKKKPLIRYEKNSNGPRTSWYKDGRVDLSEVPEIRPELKEVVLSQDQDPFFKKNMYLNFGDLGALQSKNTQSFRKLSGNVSKHVTLVGELSRKVGSENLLEVSEVEQSLACNDAHASDLKNVQRLIQSPTVTPDNKLRLVALYSLRYEKHPFKCITDPCRPPWRSWERSSKTH